MSPTAGVSDVQQRAGVVEGRHGPIPIRRYGPDDFQGTPLVWVHGGGFHSGGLDQAESHAPAVAVALTGRPVVTVDYRLVSRPNKLRQPKRGRASGVRFPVPAEDVIDVFQAIRREYRTAFLGGASAGACLSAASAVRMRAEGLPGPAGLVLAYGLYHSALPALPAELRSKLRGIYRIPQFTPKIIDRICRNYAGSEEGMRDPFAFPGGHAVKGLPPVLFLDAERDAVRASGELFADELRAADVEVRYHIVAGCIHGYFNRPSHRAFRAGITTAIDWLDELESRHRPRR